MDLILSFIYSTAMIKAVIFDFDGTLVDSEPNYAESDVATIRHFGGELTLEDHHRYIGVGARHFITEMQRIYKIDASFEEIQIIQKQEYMKRALINTPVFPEMKRLVDILQGKGIPMAVASGTQKELLEALLERTGLADYFPVVLSSEEVEKGKPEPDVFLETARLLGEDPENCLVLEDSPPGAQAAQAAGMDLISIPGPFLQDRLGEFPDCGLLIKGGMQFFRAELVLEKL